MRRLIFFIAPVFFVLGSCNFFGKRVVGDGNIKSETRNVGSFTKIDVSNNIKLHVKQGDANSLRIETDQNLMEYIEVETKGDELEIGVRDNFNLDASKAIDVYVSVTTINRIGASGACDVDADGTLTSSNKFDIDLSGASNITLDLKAPRVEAVLSGASKAVLRGETKDVSLNGSGASEFHCYDLMSENADVDVSGASNADVFASVSLKADASGASNIRYKGSPSVSSNTSGAGSVGKGD